MVLDAETETVLSLTKQELPDYCHEVILHAVKGICEQGGFHVGITCRWCHQRITAKAYRYHQPRCDLNPRVVARKERLARIAKYSKPAPPSQI